MSGKLTSEVQKEAWELLCRDMAGGLHQYDFWEDVPFRVQSKYVSIVVTQWFLEERKTQAQTKWERESLEEYERSRAGHGDDDLYHRTPI